MKNKNFLLALTLLLVTRGSFADHNYVPSGSMEPNIAVGDEIFVNKLAYDLKLPFSDIRLKSLAEPRRGDIVVFLNPQNGIRMVKRLIAVPGDHVRVHDGFIWINGQLVSGSSEGQSLLHRSTDDEIYYTEHLGSRQVRIRRTRSLFRPDDCELVVPRGKYFAMGDNRDNSADSRAWGLIPRENIAGRAVGVIFNVAFNPRIQADLSRIGRALN